jgi:hypothetical protein
MSELSDNPELQAHSQAVLYILSAVSPPQESIEAISDQLRRCDQFFHGMSALFLPN